MIDLNPPTEGSGKKASPTKEAAEKAEERGGDLAPPAVYDLGLSSRNSSTVTLPWVGFLDCCNCVTGLFKMIPYSRLPLLRSLIPGWRWNSELVFET